MLFETLLAAIGMVPMLRLRRAQLRALTAQDLCELRDTCGLTPAMLDTVLTMANDDDTRDVRIDFEHETVTPVS